MSNTSKNAPVYATIGGLIKNSTIYSDCNESRCGAVEPFELEHLKRMKDVIWGPETNLWQKCPKCGSSNTGVKVIYSGLPHGEFAGGVIGVKV